MSETRCEAVQERLTESWLGRRAGAADDRAHAAACPLCRAHAATLEQLGEALDGVAAPAPPPEQQAALETRLREELRRAGAARAPEVVPARAALPRGYRRELARLLLAAVAPLPLVLLWNVGVLVLGSELLRGIVPDSLVNLLGALYAIAAAGWLAILYGAIPLVAHRQVTQRHREVLS
jgi:hypothetical protein